MFVWCLAKVGASENSGTCNFENYKFIFSPLEPSDKLVTHTVASNNVIRTKVRYSGRL